MRRTRNGRGVWCERGGGHRGAMLYAMPRQGPKAPGRSNPLTLQNVHIPDKSDSLPVIRGEAWLVGFDHRTNPAKVSDT